MKTILIVMGRYLPGYKDGGPIRSIVNLVEALGDEYKFKIVTLDRDAGDAKSYDSVTTEEWNLVGKAEVYYTQKFTKKLFFKLLPGVDLIYVCGCFNDYFRYIMYLKKCGKIDVPIVIASMGLFSEGAFNIKKRKKQMYIFMLKLFGLTRNITWSATSEFEVRDIKKIISADAECCIAQDLPRQIGDLNYVCKSKDKGMLKVAFLSRISKKKNLLFAIECLKHVFGDIHFSIYGPKEDKEYWNECLDKLECLGENIKYEYKGSVESEKVISVLQKEDVFLFPTMGENFGHVILEAMMASCPVIISDQTPWNDLQKNGVGYSISLRNKDLFTKALQDYVDMNYDDFNDVCRKAFLYAKSECANDKLLDKYRAIFNMN